MDVPSQGLSSRAAGGGEGISRESVWVSVETRDENGVCESVGVCETVWVSVETRDENGLCESVGVSVETRDENGVCESVGKCVGVCRN